MKGGGRYAILQKLLDLSFSSVFTLLPCSQPWSRDKMWCFDAHAQWLQGILPGHADAQPVIHKRWLQTCPPTHRSPSEDDSSLVFCTAKLLTHFYQPGKVSARKQMILHNKLNGAFFFLLNSLGVSCCRFSLLTAVWAQINDTGEAPPDTTEVQWLVFKHSCVPETIFSV